MALVALGAFAASETVNDKPSVTKTFTLDQPGTLEVVTSGGKIAVEGNDGNKVEVQAFVRKKGKLLSPSDPALEAFLEKADLKIEKSGTAITAIARNNDDWKLWNNVSVSFHISVPHAMSCNLVTSGGSISITDLSGSQAMKTSGGRITAEGTRGEMDAHTSGGGIHISQQEGDMQLHTSGGSINIKKARGSIKGHTSGGRIRLEDISGDVDVHTSGGGIDINGYAEYVKATTSGGGINADISGLSKMLVLKTSGGGIYASIPSGLGLDLDLKGQKVDIDLSNFSGEAEKGKITGTMNGGGIPVEMKTSGGGINLVFK